MTRIIALIRNVNLWLRTCTHKAVFKKATVEILNGSYGIIKTGSYPHENRTQYSNDQFGMPPFKNPETGII